MERIRIIDLHCHILPGLDDGAQSLEESLEMVHLAAQSGVREIVATPHCAGDRIRETTDGLMLLREALEDMRIPVTVHPGMEILGLADTAQLLSAGKLLALNGSQYPLIEFPFHEAAEDNTQILSDVIRAGYRPLIAHPERYGCVQEDPECINQWYQMGCLFQINRGSLLGRFGRAAQDMAFSLIDRGFATVVASDAHSGRMRTPWLLDVYELLEHEFSPRAARHLMRDNPQRILNNERILPVKPAWFE